MKEFEVPPFYTGQEVVAVRSSYDGLIKKGNDYTVLSIRKFCCSWVVYVGFALETKYYCVYCSECRTSFPNDRRTWTKATFFAPKHKFGAFISMKELVEKELETIGVN